MNALDIIRQSEILSQADLSAVQTMQGALRTTWETAQVFRTRTEMEVAVLKDAKFPTPDAKYWQAVREQGVMFCELVELSYEHRKKAVDLKKLTRAITVEADELERELKQVEIEQITWHMGNMARVAHHRIREIKEWEDIKAQLLPHLKYGTENVNAHQYEAMRVRYQKEASLIGPQTPPADARNILGIAEMLKKGAADVHQGSLLR